MSCTNCLNTKINPCVNEIYINLPLTANTPYIVTVTDHFGNEYQAEVETNADGAFYLYMDNTYPYTESDFPEGLFSNPITFVITTIGGDPVELESGSVTYDCFTTEPTSNRGENVIEPDGYPVVIEGECCFEISGTPYYLAMFNATGDNVEDSAIWQELDGTAHNFWLFSPDGANNAVITIADDSANSGINMPMGLTSLFYVDNAGGLAGVYIGENVHYAQLFSDENNDYAGIELYWEDGLGDSCMVNMINDNGLQFVITDDKTITFSQETQDGLVQISLNDNYCNFSVENLLNYAELDVSDTAAYLGLFNDSEDSSIYANVNGDDTDTYFVMTQATVEIFKASADGISTDGSTNAWQLGAASAGAPTADSKIRVSINGVDYDIAAEAV